MTTCRSVLIGWIALCCLSACGGISYAGDDDPVIGEKPLSQLVKQLRSENRGFQIRAARALAEAPTNARPKIIEQVIPVLKSPRENDKFVAAQVLGEYGPISRVAVPDLLPMLKGTQYERNRAAAAKALGQILKDATPDKEVDEVTAGLVEAFKDSYPDVRREAATACGMIGPAAKACIPHLKPLLEEPPSAEPNMISVAAAWACERMGPLAKEHIDLLITLMHRYASWATPAYMHALRGIGPLQDNIVPNMVDTMEQWGPWSLAGQGAFHAFETYGPKAAGAKDYMKRILRDTPGNRVNIEPLIAATRVLGAMGPIAKDALELLEKMRTYQSHPHAEIPKEKHDILHKEAEAAIAKVKAQAGSDPQAK